MAFRPGYSAFLALDSAAGTPVNLSPYIDDVSMSVSTEMGETSTIGTATKAFIPLLVGGDTIPLAGPYDVAVHTHLANAKGTSDAGTTLTIQYGPGGSVSGQAKMSAEVFISNYTLKSAVGSRSDWSATLQVTAATTLGTW